MAKTKTITKIQFRRGTDEDRKKITLADGEPGWVTDSTERALYIGDGVTKGGIKIFTEGTANISSGSTGSMAYYDGVTSISDAHWIYTDYNNGSPVLNIGHGTTANTTSLKINGTLKIPTNAVDGYVLTSNPTGDCYWAAAAGGSGGGQWSTVTAGINYTETGKNVGIGTSTPTKKLEVVGAIKASAGLWASALNLETKNTVTGTVTGGFNVYGSGGYLGVELRGTSNGSYIDFANDLTTDFDARIAHMGSTAVAGVSSALAIRGTSLVPGAVKVGINTETPNCDLTVNGCISASGTIHGVGASTKTLLDNELYVFKSSSGGTAVDPTASGLIFNLKAGDSSITITEPGEAAGTLDMSGIPAGATEICLFASIDTRTNTDSDFRWEYKHATGTAWHPLVRSQNGPGYPNSGTCWVPLDSSGELSVRLKNDTGTSSGVTDDIALQIIGYAKTSAPGSSTPVTQGILSWHSRVSANENTYLKLPMNYFNSGRRTFLLTHHGGWGQSNEEGAISVYQGNDYNTLIFKAEEGEAFVSATHTITVTDKDGAAVTTFPDQTQSAHIVSFLFVNCPATAFLSDGHPAAISYPTTFVEMSVTDLGAGSVDYTLPTLTSTHEHYKVVFS